MLEDELLYSTLARYTVRRLVRRTGIGLGLSGKTYAPINYHFPTALEHLINILPYGHTHTVDDVIDKHTLFPFYAPFMSPSKAADSRLLMKNGFKIAISVKLGINASRATKISHLRYCSQCVSDDVQKHGFPYWHRIHQLPNIGICTEHQSFLYDSSVSIAQTRESYIAAETAIPVALISKGVSPAVGVTSESIELLLAQDAKWLLETKLEPAGSTNLAKRYTDLMREKRFVTQSGIPRLRQIRRAIKNFYPANYLASIGLAIKEDNKKDWIYRLLSLSHREFSQPPVNHLLFIHFLGLDAKVFFSRKNDLPLFFDLSI